MLGNKSIVFVRGNAFDLLVIVVFFGVISAGILVPVYADEVALRMMRSTFFSEHGRNLTLLPQCSSELGFSIPLSWFPAAIGTSLLASILTPLGIRVAGVATAVLWIFSLAVVVRMLIPNRNQQLSWLATMLAILGVGVLPLTLVLARSEQWLLLFLTVFTLFPSVLQRIKRVGVGFFSLVVVFCVIVSFAFYAHPKALFFLPLLGVSAYFSFYERSRFAFLLTGVFICWTALQTVEVTRVLVACPDAPIFAAYMASQTTKLSMLLQAPLATSWELGINLAKAPYLISKHLLFQSAYQSAWLPPVPSPGIGPLTWGLNGVILVEIGLVIVSGLLMPLVAVLKSIKRRDFGAVFMVMVALWVGVTAHLAIYKAWNFYGGALVLGLSILLIVLGVVQAQWMDRAFLACRWLRSAFCLVSLVSAVVLAVQVVPGLFKAMGSGHIGLKDQPLSVPAYGFSERRERIRKFADECSLSGDGAHRLVVDDLTYFAFNNLREPLHLVYFYEDGFGSDVKGEATIRMLERLGVEGIVAQCTFMPSLLLKQARKDGNLCCVKFPLQSVSR